MVKAECVCASTSTAQHHAYLIIIPQSLLPPPPPPPLPSFPSPFSIHRSRLLKRRSPANKAHSHAERMRGSGSSHRNYIWFCSLLSLPTSIILSFLSLKCPHSVSTFCTPPSVSCGIQLEPHVFSFPQRRWTTFCDFYFYFFRKKNPSWDISAKQRPLVPH